MKRYNRVLVSAGERKEVERFTAPSTGEPVVIYKHSGVDVQTISLRDFENRRTEIESEYRASFRSGLPTYKHSEGERISESHHLVLQRRLLLRGLSCVTRKARGRANDVVLHRWPGSGLVEGDRQSCRWTGRPHRQAVRFFGLTPTFRRPTWPTRAASTFDEARSPNS